MKDKNIEMIEDFEKVFDKHFPMFGYLDEVDRIRIIENFYEIYSAYIQDEGEQCIDDLPLSKVIERGSEME